MQSEASPTRSRAATRGPYSIPAVVAGISTTAGARSLITWATTAVIASTGKCVSRSSSATRTRSTPADASCPAAASIPEPIKSAVNDPPSSPATFLPAVTNSKDAGRNSAPPASATIRTPLFAAIVSPRSRRRALVRTPRRRFGRQGAPGTLWVMRPSIRVNPVRSVSAPATSPPTAAPPPPPGHPARSFPSCPAPAHKAHPTKSGCHRSQVRPRPDRPVSSSPP